MKISAIIPAAGTGTRYSTEKPKLFEDIKGLPVIMHTLNTIASVAEIDEIVICTSEELLESISELIENHNIPNVKKVILGGQTRQESVFKGLIELEASGRPDFVVIHDGARPLISVDVVKNSIETALKTGASTVAVPVKDTIKRVDASTGEIIETLNREELWSVQTPQVFKFDNILRVHQDFRGENLTDDAALMEKAGYKVFVSQGSYKNLKITTEEDIQIANNLDK